MSTALEAQVILHSLARSMFEAAPELSEITIWMKDGSGYTMTRERMGQSDS